MRKSVQPGEKKLWLGWDVRERRFESTNGLSFSLSWNRQDDAWENCYVLRKGLFSSRVLFYNTLSLTGDCHGVELHAQLPDMMPDAFMPCINLPPQPELLRAVAACLNKLADHIEQNPEKKEESA